MDEAISRYPQGVEVIACPIVYFCKKIKIKYISI